VLPVVAEHELAPAAETVELGTPGFVHDAMPELV
jgi:hypothetical protein